MVNLSGLRQVCDHGLTDDQILVQLSKSEKKKWLKTNKKNSDLVFHWTKKECTGL